MPHAHLPDIDLNLLTTLDALLQEGSVAGAARKLGLSASAMSRALARLRAATGDPLLVRAGRGLVPTPHAMPLRDRVHDLVHDVQTVLRPGLSSLDLSTLERQFTLRVNEGFLDVFAARLVNAVAEVAPGVRLRFAPKPDKDIGSLRGGLVDLEIGVLGESGPEVRVQALYQDHFVGAVRQDHPLLAEPVTPERYAACNHVVTSRRGQTTGPVDAALADLGLVRRVIVVVPSFPAALAIARASDLVALVPASLVVRRPGGGSEQASIRSFPLPVKTDAIAVSQIWHPRMDADPANRWLRGLVRDVCKR